MGRKLEIIEKSGNSPDFSFHCPGCKCSHGIWTTRLPNHYHSIWNFNGKLESPTFSPSLLVRSVETCHSYITDGKIKFLEDCSHALAGQTVEMEDVE